MSFLDRFKKKPVEPMSNLDWQRVDAILLQAPDAEFVRAYQAAKDTVTENKALVWEGTTMPEATRAQLEESGLLKKLSTPKPGASLATVMGNDIELDTVASHVYRAEYFAKQAAQERG